MKLFGSSYSDTLIGTGTDDTILGNRGADLIYGGQGGSDSISAGADNDLISGFSVNLSNLRASPARGSSIDGGSDFDTLIVDITPATRISMLQSATNVMKVSGVEEIIYSVGSTSDKQQIAGTNNMETICSSGTANVHGMSGDDYIFSQDGNDTLSGDNGNDYLSAGAGYNTVSGGNGADVFAFHFQGAYQYTEVTDFNAHQDKIAIIIRSDQYATFLDVEDTFARAPDNAYGDGVQGSGSAINDYVSYDSGRFFSRSDFDQADKNNKYGRFVTYDHSTGSVLMDVYSRDENNALHEHQVLLAHIDGAPKLTMDQFEFLVM